MLAYMCVQGPQMSDALEWALQAVVSLLQMLRAELRFSGRTASAPYYSAVLPGPCSFALK